MPRRTLLAAVLAVALTAAAPAGAHDSLAPPGSAPNWLPKEGWVFQHWLPFDERDLRAQVHINAASLERWLLDDHHTIAMLAHRRGVTSVQLAQRLTAPWQGRVDARRLGELRARTERILTQGHLAQHVLYHAFHGPGIPTHGPAIFGVSRAEFLRRRQRGATPAAIGRAHGRTMASMRAAITRLLRATAQRGVTTHSTLPGEARLMLARQLRGLSCWLTRPLPKLDPENPYGRRDGHLMPMAVAPCVLADAGSAS